MESDSSVLYFFLPLITDRSEEINQYLNNLTISPVDIKKVELDKWAGQQFDPLRLDLYGDQKKVMTECIVEALKHICRISNSNIVQNADGLLSRRQEEIPVDWIGEIKTRIPSQKFKDHLSIFLTQLNSAKLFKK